MSADRALLAKQQAALVDALTKSAPVPAGIDAQRVAIAAEGLIFKRARTVARFFPVLANSLGDDFRKLFFEFAKPTPYPDTGARQDVIDFAKFLHAQKKFPRAAARQLMLLRLTSPVSLRISRIGKLTFGLRLGNRFWIA